MYRKPQSSYRYKVGGTLGVSDPSYIKRQADTDLYQSLKNGEYCYILNSRQMGKSSLKVRTIKKLQQEENFICANIDLSSIGKTLTERQWYESIVFNLRMQFDNYGEFNWDHKSINYESLPAIALFNQFVAQVLDYIDNNIVIFIDEIDIILSLKDFTDDLFLSIREYYNRRCCEEKYKNLTFCFLGVIDRSDLIKSQEITSFNVGESIDLQGFTLEEAQPFTIGLSDTLTQQQKQDILEQILQWTGGQPFLTQKILSLIVEKLDGNNLNVEEFIKQNILENWHYQDKLLHLKTIESRLLYDEEVVARLLGIYKKILELKEVETDTSLKIEESKLILSGLVIQQGNKLKIKCKIYEYIFNLDWVNKELDKVRPYESNRVNLWLKNNQDKSQLLTDSELQKALNWSVKQNVSIEDHQFISASQKLANTKKIFKTITLVFIGCLIFIVTISIFSLLQVNRKNRNLEIANSQLEIEKSQLEFQSGQEIKALKLIMQTAQIFKKSKSIYLEENVNDLVLNLGQILLNTTEKNYLEVDEGNNNKISSVNFNPQGTILATGLDNGDIKLWNTQGGILKTLKSHTKRVYNVKFNEDGSLLGSVSEDGDIKLWSLDDSEPITLHFSKAKKAIYSISFRDRKIVASSRDGLVGLWESPEDQTPAIFQASTNEIYDVNLSKDGKIVTASKDGLVQLWDSPEDKEPETLIDNKEAIYSLSWSSDDQTLAASSRNGTVTLYNMTDGSKKTITAHSKEVYDVVFSSNNLMATASEDEQIKLWDLTGKEVKAIKVNRGAVHNVNFSPDGQMLAAVSTDGKVNIWSLKKDTDFQSGIKVASFSSDGKWLAFGTKQGKVSLVDLTSTELKTKNLVTTCLITKELIATENIQDSGTKNALEITSLSFSLDRNWLAFGTKQGHVSLMNLATQEELCLEKNNVSEEIYSLSFDRDNKWLVAGTRQGNIYTWNLRNDNIKLRQYKNVGQEPIYSMNFLDNLGKPLFIIGDNEGTISIFNLEKNKLEKFKKVHSKAIYKISVSGDGIIASASADNTVKLYKLDDGELNKLSILGGREEEKEDAIHNGVVSDVIFSSNNKLLVTISTDKYIRIWEKTQNKQGKIIYRYLERFKEPEVGVSSIKFQSNQELLIAKNDGTLASWYINESKLERLDRLLEDGCLWLEDYLSTQPDKTKDLIGCNSLKK